MTPDPTSRPEARSWRLFIGFEVPEEVQRAIDDATGPLRARFPEARWVPTQNRHVTLKFLGRTRPHLRRWVEERVARVASGAEPIDTRPTSIGAFPGGRRARVLWIGLDDAGGDLAALAGALDEVLAEEFDPETRPYTPHCTIARSDRPLRLHDGALDAQLPRPPFTIDRIVLFRSHLARPSPRYEGITSFTLGG